jgi:hypothetical protein
LERGRAWNGDTRRKLDEMLEDAEVPPELLEGMLTRLATFIERFAEALDEPAQRRHALESMTGLLSDLKHKTGASCGPPSPQPGLLHGIKLGACPTVRWLIEVF